MQLPEQQASQPGHKGFLPGRSGNPRGRLSAAQRRALVLAKAHELAQPIGGFDQLNTIEQELILRAAELLQLKPRGYEQRVRRDNLVSRILRDALRQHESDGSNPTSPLRERLAAGQGA
jgi:hypothetical protein